MSDQQIIILPDTSEFKYDFDSEKHQFDDEVIAHHLLSKIIEEKIKF